MRETTGFVIVGSNWHYGVRNTITKEPVQSPQDMKGLKIRVPGNQLQVDSMGALGAAGTPIVLGMSIPHYSREPLMGWRIQSQ